VLPTSPGRVLSAVLGATGPHGCHKPGHGGASPDVVESPALRALRAGAVNDLPRSAAAAGVAPTSFDRLFDEEYARVAAIARRVLGDPDAAEDVAQEVFLDLHRRFGDNPGAQASAWARTAAVHTALNVIRANRRRTVREELYAPGPETVNDPQAAVETAETSRVVRSALARIPKRMATVLVLRYSGLSYAEMASALGIGVNGVGTRLRRAEARLRKEIGDASI
jgi:RNA polymerase sigma factor (sigma-70 family)